MHCWEQFALITDGQRLSFCREGVIHMSRAGNLPPTECPICGEIIYTESSAGTPTNVWDLYFLHMNPNHPEYLRWNRKMGSRYLLALVPLVGLIFLGIALGGSPSQAPLSASVGSFVFALSFFSTIPVLFAVWISKRRGTDRFRKLWKGEHARASGHTRPGNNE